LWFSQEDVKQYGHAIECRIYAEDVRASFRPSPGPLRGYREPNGPWVRVDSGVVQGMTVPIHYDPMVAKLVVWGQTRDEAIGRTRRALLHYQVVGIPTSIPFFLALLDDPDFQAGRYSTAFIHDAWLADRLRPPEEAEDWVAVGAAIARFERDVAARPAPAGAAASAWRWGQPWGGRGRGTR
jgi:acetyl/propionyl-CoA carboxylase alpha subunit